MEPSARSPVCSTATASVVAAWISAWCRPAGNVTIQSRPERFTPPSRGKLSQSTALGSRESRIHARRGDEYSTVNPDAVAVGAENAAVKSFTRIGCFCGAAHASMRLSGLTEARVDERERRSDAAERG